MQITPTCEPSHVPLQGTHEQPGVEQGLVKTQTYVPERFSQVQVQGPEQGLAVVVVDAVVVVVVVVVVPVVVVPVVLVVEVVVVPVVVVVLVVVVLVVVVAVVVVVVVVVVLVVVGKPHPVLAHWPLAVPL